jgi:hypothetical protein
LQFEALDESECFEITSHQRLSLRSPEYRVHGRALGEIGQYRLSRITLNHPALAERVYDDPPGVSLTIVDKSESFPELVSAERYVSQTEPSTQELFRARRGDHTSAEPANAIRKGRPT